MLLAGTPDGVYRLDPDGRPSGRGADPERVLSGSVRELSSRDGAPGVFAATDSGLYLSDAEGYTWRGLGLPADDVWSVSSSAAVDRDADGSGGYVYAGVRPAELYRSTDGGETWIRLGLRDRPFSDRWPTGGGEDAGVRSVDSPEGDPGTVVAGIEVGGMVWSDDSGRSWYVADGVPDDVHHVLCLGPGRWVVSCGTGGPSGEGGVYTTSDSGDAWRRLDTGGRGYVRETHHSDGMYTAANRTPPPWSPPDAAVFVGGTEGLDRVSYPGEPGSFAISWASADGAVFAGTNDGRIIRRTDEGWGRVASVPVSEEDRRAYGVTSLAVV